MFRHILARAAVAAVLVPLAAPAGAELVIDSFVTPQTLSLGFGGPDAAASSVPAAEALGGERDASLQRLAGTEPADLLVNPTGSDRLLSLSAGPSSIVEWMIVWDGVDGSPDVDETGLGGLDLTQGGANTGFLVSVLSDLPGQLQIELTDMSGGRTSAEIHLPGGDEGLVDRLLPFSAFDLPAAAAAVGSVALVVGGEAGLDVQVDSIRVVPEPVGAGGAALVALWVLAHGRARERSPRG
jgi:hypothetical protein